MIWCVIAVAALAAAALPAGARAAGATNGAIAFDCPDGGVCLVNPDGSGYTQLTSQGGHPRWSPDGTLITYASGSGIYVMDANGSNQTQLTTASGDSDPSFSADGNSVFFERSEALYEVPVSGGAATPVAGISGPAADPAQSPDGSSLAFDTGNDIVVESGGTQATLTSGYDLNPGWSTDGSLIYFEHLPSGGGQYSIESVPPSGGAPTTVLSDDDENVAPSPDGTELAYVHIGSGLWTAQVNGSDAAAIPNTGGAFSPAWQPTTSSNVYASPALSTTPTAGPVAPGTTITDTATLSGVAPGAAGTITFTLYSDSGCSNAVDSGTAAVSGNGEYTFAGIDVTQPGVYHWTATYSGDATTDTYGAAEVACGSESTTVGTPPTLTSSATAGPVAAGTTITDTATLAGAAAGAAGTLTFTAYSDSGCTTQVYSGTATVSGNGEYAPAGFAPQQDGTYYWTASYSGDPSTGTLAVGEACGGTNESTIVTTPGAWSGSGGGSEPGTSTVVSDGTSGAAEFSYDIPNSCDCGVSGSWTFATTAASAGQVVLPWSYAGFHAYYDVTVGLEAFVTHDNVTTTTSLVSEGPVSCSPCTPPSGGFSYSGATTLSVQAGDSYGFIMSGSNGDSNATLQGALTVDVSGNDAWTRAQSISLDANGDGSASGSIDLSGEARWYKFNVTPGGSVQVDLGNLPANYDLSLFSDIGQAYSNLTTPEGLQTEAADYGNNAYSPSVFSPSVFSPSVFSPSVFSPSVFSPSVFSPSVFSPSVFSPSVFSPSVFSPSVFSPSVFSPSVFSPSSPEEEADYDGAQVQSLIGVSDNPGTADQNIYADVWNDTGSFYIRVNGPNGTYDPGAKFSLSVHENVGTCGGVAPDTTDPLLSSAVPSGSYQTLILSDYSRMTDDGTLSTMESTLTRFAALPSVDGTIAELDQISPQLNTLYAQADSHADCPYAENLVADAIRNIVQDYRASNPGLKYVVIAGNDHVIPFFRYPDTAGIGPESDYVPPVISTSPSDASLASNDVLSQDAYGATTFVDASGVELPVPDLPVGRLVDTPTEITGLLNAYTSGTSGGVVPTPTSSLVTGYDFMTRGADAVEDDLSAGLGSGATNDTLITNDGVPPSQTGSPPLNSWTATQLERSLLGSRHDLIFLAGHFSANNTLAADYSTTMNSTQLAASNVNLENSIVFSAGCHSGYNIVGNDVVPDVTVTPDWVEAFAQKRATLIAGTGYQYGDTDFLAYSEQLYADFAHELLVGTGPVSVGDALVEAKQAYLSATPGLQGIDVKSLLEATLYGLPMLSVNMPAGRVPAPSSSSIVTQTTPASANPGAMLGLSSDDVTLDPTLTTTTQQLEDANGNTDDEPAATYLSGPAGVDTSPGAPTLPLATYDVGIGGANVLRGVGFLGGSYSDEAGITPLTGAPGTELSGVHSTFVSSAFYPSRLWSVNYFDGLTDTGGEPTDAELMLTPAQYESDAAGSLTDTQRTFSSVDLRLFYSGNTQTYGSNTPALAAPPTISRVDASSVAGSGGSETVNFSLHVVGDPSAGIQQVWVTYSGVDAGQWESLFLTQDATESTLWTGSLSGLSSQQVAALQFMVQAANGVGLVSLDNNQGAYYQVDKIPAALQSASTIQAATAVTLDAPPTVGAYGSSPSISATLTAGGQPLASEPISFSLGGSTLSGTTNGSGIATVALPLVESPGGYTLEAGFGGSATLDAASASAPFTIDTLPTTLTLKGGSGAVLVGTDTGVSATLLSSGLGVPQRSVAFVLTPPRGGAAVIQTRFTNLYGVATLGVVTAPLSASSYSVQAYFGSGAPISLPADALYQASTSGTAQLDVTLPAVVSMARASASPTKASSVAWTVTFNVGVTGVTASNFALAPAGGVSGAGGLSLSGSGSTYTLTASTGSGSGALGLNLATAVGITDANGDALAGTFTGQVYAIDKTAPSATISFPASATAYKASSYAAGCSRPGLCGAASDASGVSSVVVSIGNGAGKYWNGSSFSAGSQTFNAAQLSAPNATTSGWSYPLVLPADGSYTIQVRTTDTLGNTEPAATYAASAAFAIDTVPPRISFSGNQGSYGLLDTIAITCSVGDPAPSSGIKTNPCTGFSIAGPAWSFKPGSNTQPNPALVAIDSAGNASAPATATFSVTATTGTLCQLTTKLVEGSARYAALGQTQKQVVNQLTTTLCSTVSSITSKLPPAAVAGLIKAYETGVQSLVTQGWLTSAQAATLTAFAATL